MKPTKRKAQVLEIASDSGPTDIRDLKDTLLEQIKTKDLPASIEISGDMDEVSAPTLQFLVALGRTDELSDVDFGPNAAALRETIEAPK